MGFLSILVSIGICKSIRVRFLPVGYEDLLFYILIFLQLVNFKLHNDDFLSLAGTLTS